MKLSKVDLSFQSCVSQYEDADVVISQCQWMQPHPLDLVLVLQEMLSV